MCGIVGAVAGRDMVPFLMQGLRRLEYRGYDSAGIAVVDGSLQRVRCCGRVAQLAGMVEQRALRGRVGIAHTRWATHGAPSERNAHPHMSGGVCVVHNGIIENHDDLRAALVARGYRFSSDTDTEAIAHLVRWQLEETADLLAAVRLALKRLRGAYAIAVLSAAHPGRMAVARHGAPLLLGLGDGENLAASDCAALLAATRRFIDLEDGDVAELTPHAVRLLDRRGKAVAREERVSELSLDSIERGEYAHYMRKEIFEQPAALAATLGGAIGLGAVDARCFGARAREIFADIDSVDLVGCGTSHHAALVARHWIEGLAGLRCNADVASEYRYRQPLADSHTLFVAISQSGETADTLAALSAARSAAGRRVLAICNVPEASLVRAADLVFLTRVGPEVSVASTKSFTAQLAILLLLAAALAKVRNRLAPSTEAQLLRGLRGLPQATADALALEPQIARWAEEVAQRDHALFLGRGVHYPIAMEGALKLKEVSYIHAEAYPAGELKHGALALVDDNMPVLALAPNDALVDKLKSNLQEVRARGGKLYVLCSPEVRLPEAAGFDTIRLRALDPPLFPIASSIPLQLLAYHAALRRGNDVDKPRNLAKSVTVE